MHFFNLVGFQDYVTGNELPDTHTKTLVDVPIASFLPTTVDLVKLNRDFFILLSHVIVKHFKSLSFLKSSVIYHIRHPYSEIMTKPVKEVNMNKLKGHITGLLTILFGGCKTTFCRQKGVASALLGRGQNEPYSFLSDVQR